MTRACRSAAGDRLADRGLPARVFHHAEQNCASAGTIALTVLAEPLNYLGVNPKVTDCNVPQPSETPTAQFQRCESSTVLNQSKEST